MNCQEMDALIPDLARAGEIENEVRERALEHARKCPRCGERYEEERRLSAGLLAYAAASAGEQAPWRVEEKLRVALRQRRAAPVAAWRRWGWIVPLAAGSVAAAVLLLRSPAPTPPAPPAVAAITLPPALAVPVRSIPASVPRHVRRRRPPKMVRESDPAQRVVETDFFPVAQGDEWSPRDGAQLMRVEIPKSALSVFGLPAEEGRGPDRVQADVVLSDDGLLRAIRFVR